MNAWLLDQCIAYAKGHPHPERREETIWHAFEAERPALVPYAGRFDGFHAVPASVSKTCLVRGCFFNVVDLVNKLEAEARSGRLAYDLSRKNFIRPR